MRRIRCFVPAVVVFLFCALAWSQQPASTAAGSGPGSDEVAAFIAREFGPDFKLVPTIPPMMVDLNRDGHEDIAVVATCASNPMALSEKMHYKIEDPYGKYFGFGNPSVSLQFNTEDPKTRRLILIAHNWRDAAVGPKFVLLNIPIVQIRIGYMMLRKHTVQVIETEDEIGVQAAVYWDGKRYHWEAVSMADHQ
ncbi:MAG TPA: hypothetical protein VMU24_12660 [Candidatus Acidoferrales bacterium]|nr:hypothetical protein [Candidatus Acidoferrales bacterium]